MNKTTRYEIVFTDGVIMYFDLTAEQYMEQSTKSHIRSIKAVK